MDDICPTCGDEFSSEYGVKQHHAKTHGESIAGEPVDCDNCDKTVRKKKDTIEKWENLFCSDECRFEYTRGENHPDYDRVDVECDWCGEDAEKYPRTIRKDHENTFCDMKCRNEYYRNGGIPTGEDHPSWKGGYINPYGRGWEKMRERVLELDEHQCKSCGEQKNLHVHHINSVRNFDNEKDAHYLENLVTLCDRCHPKFEHMDKEKQIESLNIDRLEVDA